MQSKEASINNVHGLGYAIISTDYRGMKDCKGLFVATNFSEAMPLMNAEKTVYSGIIHDSGTQVSLSFPVIITRIQDNRVEFQACGNPYAG